MRHLKIRNILTGCTGRSTVKSRSSLVLFRQTGSSIFPISWPREYSPSNSRSWKERRLYCQLWNTDNIGQNLLEQQGNFNYLKPEWHLFFLCTTIFNTASFVAPQILKCARDAGIELRTVAKDNQSLFTMMNNNAGARTRRVAGVKGLVPNMPEQTSESIPLQ